MTAQWHPKCSLTPEDRTEVETLLAESKLELYQDSPEPTKNELLKLINKHLELECDLSMTRQNQRFSDKLYAILISYLLRKPISGAHSIVRLTKSEWKNRDFYDLYSKKFHRTKCFTLIRPTQFHSRPVLQEIFRLNPKRTTLLFLFTTALIFSLFRLLS